jgi:hypothetical protein
MSNDGINLWLIFPTFLALLSDGFLYFNKYGGVEEGHLYTCALH